MRTLIRIASLLLLATVTGCAQPIVVNAFGAPDRPDAEIATLHIDEVVRLTALDGAAAPGLPAGLTGADSAAPRTVRLLPGEHTLVVGIRPRTQVYSKPIYSYVPHGGGCHDARVPRIVHYQTHTNHLPGSREDESLSFTAVAGHTYRLKIDDPPDWFTKTEPWSARVVEKTDRWSDPTTSTSLGRQPRVTEEPLAGSAKASYNRGQ